MGPEAQAHGDFDARENVSRTSCFSDFFYHNHWVILQAMPVIHFVPVQNYLPPKENYESPLYKTNIRAGILSTTGQSTNYILNVSLPTDKDPKFWVLQGTAMVTMLND